MLFLTNQARDLGVVQEFPLSFVLPLACAMACHYLIETPAIQLGRGLSKTFAEDRSPELMKNVIR
jgi:hypothetical protein